MRRNILAAVLIITLVGIGLVATPADVTPERLSALGRVWVTVKFAHPRVALTERDWDRALVDAWPAVKAATTDEGFADAVGTMLATLDDPVTRVERQAQPRPPTPGIASVKKIGAGADEAVILDLRAGGAFTNSGALNITAQADLDGLKRASKVVIDLRGVVVPTHAVDPAFNTLNELLVSEPLAMPSSRAVIHSGYRAQAGGARFYSSQQAIDAAAVVRPRPDAVKKTVVFLVDHDSPVPPIALALQHHGSGAIVTLDTAPRTPVRLHTVALGGGFVAMIRVDDLMVGGRRWEATPDATIAATASAEDTWRRALDAVTVDDDGTRARYGGVDDPAAVTSNDATYADQPYPSEGHRLLAAFRLWGVIELFFPYKQILDRPWEAVLTEFTPRVLAAKDELEYAQALARMAARTQDSHVSITGSAAYLKWTGEFPPPVSVRFIEDKPIVTRIYDRAATSTLEVGDEIVSIDGEPVAARIKRLEDHLAYSTRAGRDRSIQMRLLHGEAGSTATLGVRGSDGAIREVPVARDSKSAARPQRNGEVARVLDGNIGYVDLERLELSAVPAMFETFRGTLGIIFDMRGYPRGTAWAIAPRINTRRPSSVALFFRPQVLGGSTSEQLSFLQPLPPGSGAVYTRPTAMLIDERAISQSEHSGLFFKAANGTTFIGSPTTGANGDVTSLVLPGGLQMRFTGHDVRWPDGRQLQRIGLIPDIEIRPTIAGIRAGRDEVLERAVAHLRALGGSSSKADN
jgi:C-terminal processing protease CtpA/Prc